MRVSGDELAVDHLAHTEPHTREALAALGRLLASSSSAALQDGTPLAAHCAHVPLDPEWRTKVGSCSDSLWSRLEFLTSLWPQAADDPDPLARLRALATVADQEFT